MKGIDLPAAVNAGTTYPIAALKGANNPALAQACAVASSARFQVSAGIVCAVGVTAHRARLWATRIAFLSACVKTCGVGNDWFGPCTCLPATTIVGVPVKPREENVSVTWPATGKTDTFAGVALDRVYTLREGAEELVPLDVVRFDLAAPAKR